MVSRWSVARSVGQPAQNGNESLCVVESNEGHYGCYGSFPVSGLIAVFVVHNSCGSNCGSFPWGVAGGVVGAVIVISILLTLIGNIGPFRHKSKRVDSATNYDPYQDVEET